MTLETSAKKSKKIRQEKIEFHLIYIYSSAKQRRIIGKLAAECMERVDGFACFGEISSVIFEVRHVHAVIDMRNAVAFFAQCLSPQYVLVAIGSDTLIERTPQQHFALH